MYKSKIRMIGKRLKTHSSSADDSDDNKKTARDGCNQSVMQSGPWSHSNALFKRARAPLHQPGPACCDLLVRFIWICPKILFLLKTQLVTDCHAAYNDEHFCIVFTVFFSLFLFEEKDNSWTCFLVIQYIVTWDQVAYDKWPF